MVEEVELANTDLQYGKSCSLVGRVPDEEIGRRKFESSWDDKVSSLKDCPGGGMVDARDLK